MLKKRIIPVLLISNDLLVKTKKFNSDRVIGNIIQSIKVFNKRESDELTIIDLDASRGKGKIEIHFLKEIISECTLPLSIGGGINSRNEVKDLLNIGFDKVIINKGFLENPKLISHTVKIFGSQSITIGIDIIKDRGKFKIFNKRNNNEDIDLIEWIKFVQDQNVGEILLTSVDNEGMMNGYNYDLLNYIYKYINKPIIMNGGCGKIKDFEKILVKKKVMGACASSIFFYTQTTPHSVKQKIRKKVDLRV